MTQYPSLELKVMVYFLIQSPEEWVGIFYAKTEYFSLKALQSSLLSFRRTVMELLGFLIPVINGCHQLQGVLHRLVPELCIQVQSCA